jgi:hypothetical protein
MQFANLAGHQSHINARDLLRNGECLYVACRAPTPF